ncbi:MAG TPA: cation-efflux pump [Terriglobia bacterium]|nr:cation-efflux pump [Terriglobia bacterium]
MPPSDSLPTREKQSVALGSLGVAAVLTSLKIVAGLLTGSLGILSEAAHSALDVVAAAVTYLSVRAADKPADSSHPFGHGKIESLSAFIETGLLLVVCGWMITEAVRRLFFRGVEVEPSVWAFAVMLVSVTLDTFRSRALFRVARKYDSQALEADALHFSMDVYSSTAVILGLALVSVARLRHLPALKRADPLAALVVAAITIYISARLGKRTVDALVDAAPAGASGRIARGIAGLPGVVEHDRIRVRGSGQQLFVDLRVTLESNIPFEHAQLVVESVERKVREIFPGADVTIHAAPRKPAVSDLVERIRAVAHRENFLVHDVTAYIVKGRVKVSLDLEVDPGLSLEAAHGRATRLEAEIERQLPEVDEVTVHIEPLLRRVEAADEARAVAAGMERELMNIARDTPGLVDCHSLEAHTVGANVLVSLHCTLDPSLPVARVHDITEDLEFRFRKEFPQISKVSIHAEPSEQ